MGYTFEEIRDRIKDRLQNPTSTIEGTFSMDNAAGGRAGTGRASTIWRLNRCLDAAFLDTAAGENLDSAPGISMKPGGRLFCTSHK